jgi:ABC-type phosphate transport system substrate-binding protein
MFSENHMTRRTILFALAFPAALPAAEGFAIITQKDNVRPLTKGQVKKLILGEATNWAGGGKITLILAPAGEVSRGAALKQIAGMTEADYNRNLIHLGFVGQADATPKIVASTAAVRLAVQHSAGAIGIIPVGEVDDEVKKLDIE